MSIRALSEDCCLGCWCRSAAGSGSASAGYVERAHHIVSISRAAAEMGGLAGTAIPFDRFDEALFPGLAASRAGMSADVTVTLFTSGPGDFGRNLFVNASGMLALCAAALGFVIVSA